MNQARGILLRELVNVQIDDKSGCKQAIMKGLLQCSTLDRTALGLVTQASWRKMKKNSNNSVCGWMPQIHKSVSSRTFITNNKREFEMMKGRVKVVIDLLENYYTVSEKKDIQKVCFELLKGAN